MRLLLKVSFWLVVGITILFLFLGLLTLASGHKFQDYTYRFFSLGTMILVAALLVISFLKRKFKI